MTTPVELTEHFTWAEVTESAKAKELGIDNSVPAEIVPAVINTANEMEAVRRVLGKPIHVNSWYRCLELNCALGSKSTSQHPKGEAVDFTCEGFGSCVDVAHYLTLLHPSVPFDQLILEHTWIHISFCSDPSVAPRGQVLSLLRNGKYMPGLTNADGVPYVFPG